MGDQCCIRAMRDFLLRLTHVAQMTDAYNLRSSRCEATARFLPGTYQVSQLSLSGAKRDAAAVACEGHTHQPYHEINARLSTAYSHFRAQRPPVHGHVNKYQRNLPSTASHRLRNIARHVMDMAGRFK